MSSHHHHDQGSNMMMNVSSPEKIGLSRRRQPTDDHHHQQQQQHYQRSSSSGSYNDANASPSPVSYSRQNSGGSNYSYNAHHRGQYYNQHQNYTSHYTQQQQAQAVHSPAHSPAKSAYTPPHSPCKKRQQSSSSWSFKDLDLFPKVQHDFSITTHSGGITTLMGYIFILAFCFIEITSWNHQNSGTKEHVMVHTRLEKELHVSLNITFPSVACSDLVVESIDIGGDSILLTSSLTRTRLHQIDGRPLTHHEQIVADQTYKQEQRKFEEQLREHRVKSVKVQVAGYCGSCYGAHEVENQCCNTCEEVIAAYKKKGWSDRELRQNAEQCNDGNDDEERKQNEKTKVSVPRRLKQNEGCNLHGQVDVNRVGGIFHFHINTGSNINWMEHKSNIELSEDATKFDASHVVHELNFGPIYEGMEFRGMEGVKKEMRSGNGDGDGTGLYMYYVQLVPTTYKGGDMVEMLGETLNPNIQKNYKRVTTTVDTIQYFYTEQFQPFTIDIMKEDDYDEQPSDSQQGQNGDKEEEITATKKQKQASPRLQHIQQIILPGVFFQYELYPFSVEITKNSSPLLHLVIKLMATVGGVVTIVGWVQGWLFYGDDRKKSMFPR